MGRALETLATTKTLAKKKTTSIASMNMFTAWFKKQSRSELVISVLHTVQEANYFKNLEFFKL